MALTCLMYVALSSSWGLFCGSTRYLSLATSAFFGIGAYTSRAGAGEAVVDRVDRARRRAGDRRCGRHGRGGAAPARHLLRGADLRHDRADPARRDLFREAGDRHGGPGAHRGAGARHDLPHGAGAGRADRGAVDRGAAHPLRPGAAGHRRGRAAGADAGREHAAGQDRRLRDDGRVGRRGRRGDVGALDLHRPAHGVQSLHRLPDGADRADRRRA